MFDVVKAKKITFGISILIIIAGIIGMFTIKLNWDIDFTGGTAIVVELGQVFNDSDVEAIVKEIPDIGSVVVQKVGTEGTQVSIKTRELIQDETIDEKNMVIDRIVEKYGVDKATAVLSADNFSATAGKELQGTAVKATLLAILGMLIYVTFRFEFKFGLASIIALTHDTLIMLTIYCLFRIPINITFIAAILTILGYSINATIVIFDRVRENLKGAKKPDYAKIGNESVWQSMGRAVNTSLTTLITITVLCIVGVPSVREFAFPIIVGIIAGTYSSVFIATPLWVTMQKGAEKA